MRRDPYQDMLDAMSQQLDRHRSDVRLAFGVAIVLMVFYACLLFFLVNASEWTPTRVPSSATTTAPTPGATTY